MTPRQTKALAEIARMGDNNLRASAVMLILADNVDGLIALANSVWHDPLTIMSDWGDLSRAARVLEGRRLS
jgi:hypothetical protein